MARRLSKVGTNSGNDGCPTLYELPGTDNYVVQGDTVTDPQELTQLHNLKEQEGAVVVPRELLANFGPREPVQKIALFGPPATGKTTLASWLSTELGYPHADLDDILFTPAGPLPLEEFRRQAGEITCRDEWIVEGNFSKLADVVWHRADVLVWLDFPLVLIVYRIVRRSLYQLAGRDDSAQARRLTWSTAFFGRRSLLRTAIRKYRKNRPRYVQQVAEAAELGVEVVRLRSPQVVQRWTRELRKGPAESRSQGAARHTTGP